jgi:hypothetical protein
MPLNYDKLIHDYALLESEQPTQGLQLGKGARHLREAFQAGAVKPTDFDYGRLFEAIFGWREFRRGRNGEMATALMEAAGPIMSNAFQNITGQILFTTFMADYTSEDFVFTKMIPTRPSPFAVGEKIPGISEMGDQATVVNEQEEFPLAAVNENYIEMPDPRTRGFRIALTRLAIFADRTGRLNEKVAKSGKWMGVNKEKRAINVTCDFGPGASSDANTHRYKWRGDLMQTYANNSGTHSFDNLETTNPLLNHRSLNLMETLFNNMRDPDTGEPITIMADSLIISPDLMQLAFQILYAASVVLQAGGFAQSGNLYRTESPSPIGKTEFSSPYKIVTSRLLAAQMTTYSQTTDWFLGKPSEAFEYAENWPMHLITAPPLSHDEFTRDIVVQHRVDERGAFGTREPRLMAKATA